MSVVSDFEEALAHGLANLDADEWAIAKAQDAILAKLDPHEAFLGITGMLQVAAKQEYPFCFAACCWFVLSLARKADTSEFPSDAKIILPALEARAALLGEQCSNELAKVLAWFRLPSNISLKADGSAAA
ncbi:hypothetical protein ISP17_05045 [Dyella ginsengisoli]|uniref:Uncharacterized protein n=1 Tax=Dyella ginsengisoli TaxID=363848 RepID=A0ABW8JQD2_9GAMM